MRVPQQRLMAAPNRLLVLPGPLLAMLITSTLPTGTYLDWPSVLQLPGSTGECWADDEERLLLSTSSKTERQ